MTADLTGKSGLGIRQKLREQRCAGMNVANGESNPAATTEKSKTEGGDFCVKSAAVTGRSSVVVKKKNVTSSFNLVHFGFLDVHSYSMYRSFGQYWQSL